MALQAVLKAAADPMRIEILNLLKKGSLSAGEISSHFDVSRAAISQHLAILKEAGLVSSRREGKFVIYEINASVFEEVIVWFRSLAGGSGDGEVG